MGIFRKLREAGDKVDQILREELDELPPEEPASRVEGPGRDVRSVPNSHGGR